MRGRILSRQQRLRSAGRMRTAKARAAAARVKRCRGRPIRVIGVTGTTAAEDEILAGSATTLEFIDITG